MTAIANAERLPCSSPP